MSQMPSWRFYQGLKNEWRWYKLTETGAVVAASDRPCAELQACMANAEHAGFQPHSSFQVHTRAPAMPLATSGVHDADSSTIAAAA